MVRVADVVTEWTFWCRFPVCWLRVALHTQGFDTAYEQIRQWGWRKTPEHGWACPAHKKRVTEEK